MMVYERAEGRDKSKKMIKLYYRAAKACEGMNDAGKGMEWVEKALILEPENQSILKYREQL